MAESVSARRSNSEKRLSDLGTANWNNRGIDNHIKRPAGVSSAGLKRMGMKRIDQIPNSSGRLEDSIKLPPQCLVDNEYIYDGAAVAHVPAWPEECYEMPPAGIEAEKTVFMHNHGALADKERKGAELGTRVPAWLIGAQTKRRVDAPYQLDHDPIRHLFVKPCQFQTRPIRKTNYDNGASRTTWKMEEQQLNTGPIQMKHFTQKQDLKHVSQHVHIAANGEILYNLGGMEDLKPVGHKKYVKGDRPATRMQQYENDSRLLSQFERDRPSGRGPNPQLHESNDFVVTLYGDGNNSNSGSANQSYAGDYIAGSGNRTPDPRTPRSARERRPQSGRTPLSAREDQRKLRSSASSARSYISEGSEGRRSKSVDRGPPNQRRGTGGSSRTPMSGVFSNPGSTVSAQALKDALTANFQRTSPRR